MLSLGLPEFMILIVIVSIFTVGRAFVHWYWKIDKLEFYQRRLVELGEKQLAATEKNNRILQLIYDQEMPPVQVSPQFPPQRRHA